MVWDATLKQRCQFVDRERIDRTEPQSERFKVLQISNTIEDDSETVTVDPTIVETNAVDVGVVQILARYRKPFHLAQI